MIKTQSAAAAPNATESDIQKAIANRLQLRGWAVIRINSSAMAQAGKGKRRYLRSYVIHDTGKSAGFPDLLALKDGHFITIEVKKADGELRPAQEEFQRYAERKGIPYFVVRSADEMDEVLNEL